MAITYTKQVKSYKVEIKTKCDTTQIADDAVVAGQGIAVWGALEGRHDILIKNADGTEIIFIPFHAVCEAKVTITVTEEEVTDANCNEQG